MKKKGFTLIELLAVIVILAVIALISVPIILNVVEKARKGSFEDTAYGIIDAAKLYYASGYLDGNGNGETFTFPSDTKLKISGTKPTGGSVILDEKGKIELAIHNGKWCALKGKEEEKITITNYSVGNCEMEEIEKPESCFVVNQNDLSEITDYTCNNTVVTIPSNINGTEIKKIGDNAFKDKGLTEVIIPEGINSIGSYAFFKNRITTLIIPNSVTSIKEGAFNDNKLPNDKAIIYARKTDGSEDKSVVVSYGGSQKDNVIIPSEVKTIREFAFAYNALTSIEIPETVTEIGRGAFNDNMLSDEKAFIYSKTFGNLALVSYGGAKKRDIVIPDNVQIIDKSAFYRCKITSVTLSSNITIIDMNAFASNNLISVVIPSSVKYINAGAFMNNELTNVTISNGVENIGFLAFSNNQLKSITIPSSVTSIGNNVFSQNQNEMKVIVNKVIDSIEGSPWGASSVEWNG